MRVDPIAALTQWARWRRYWPRQELGYGRTMIDKLLSGMRTTTCPRCRGEASVVLTLKGQPARLPCPTCDGHGRVSGRSSPDQVNPATIRGTASGYDDPESEAVDRIVCAMPLLRRLVVFQEYDANGRRSDKQQRIGIGKDRYSAELESAHQSVIEGLEETRTKGGLTA